MVAVQRNPLKIRWEAWQEYARRRNVLIALEFPAEDFLDLLTVDTSVLDERGRIWRGNYNDFLQDAKTLQQYNQWDISVPFLRLKKESRGWRIVGHEGRHRAAAVINAGEKTLPVALVFPDLTEAPEPKTMSYSFFPEFPMNSLYHTPRRPRISPEKVFRADLLVEELRKIAGQEERRNPRPSSLSPLGDLELLADEGSGNFEDFYFCAPEDAEEYTPYYGRRVIWLGEEGRMFRAERDYITHISGNIFRADQLAAVRDAVEGLACEDRPIFHAPIAHVHQIDLVDVAESQIAERDGRLGELDIERPYTTGDEELDLFVALGEAYLREELGLVPRTREYIREHARLKRELKAAVKRRHGDLGKWMATVSDGNHRAFGALLAGEPYVYVKVINWNKQRGIEKELE